MYSLNFPNKSSTLLNDENIVFRQLQLNSVTFFIHFPFSQHYHIRGLLPIQLDKV
jgi:hypothetical protein